MTQTFNSEIINDSDDSIFESCENDKGAIAVPVTETLETPPSYLDIRIDDDAWGGKNKTRDVTRMTFHINNI